MGSDRATDVLTSIVDLLAEWQKENGAGYVTIVILENGTGYAYTLGDGRNYETKVRHYQAAETPAAGTAGESK